MRKLPQSGGEHVLGFIAELRQDVEAVRGSNLPGFGQSADRIETALANFEAATKYLQQALADGRMTEALAGATPYLRLFALASGGAYLARAAVTGKSPARIALCRFFAENLISETAALKDRVMLGSESLEEAGAALTAA
jgi:acyl-CoA dehydrogenase